jgi:beta-glucosidase-like glycosyl hydrolase
VIGKRFISYPVHLYQQVVASINAGCRYVNATCESGKKLQMPLVRAVKNGDISKERIDDAYKRVMYVKEKLGLP